MNGWMITPDGSAVNLARVAHIRMERRSTGSAWYVMAYFSNAASAVALTADLDSREMAVAWIEQRFRSFDQHVKQAQALWTETDDVLATPTTVVCPECDKPRAVTGESSFGSTIAGLYLECGHRADPPFNIPARAS